MVEFAIVSILLFAVVFGVIAFGLTLWHAASLENGTREGAREAVVGVWNGNDPTCTGTAAAKLECFVTNDAKVPTTTVEVLLPGGNVVGQNVVVCSLAPKTELMFPMGGPLHSVVRMRLEQIDPTATGIPTTSADWASWCHA